jgi:diguanylate cyclase (GGDEF)-like protein
MEGSRSMSNQMARRGSHALETFIVVTSALLMSVAAAQFQAFERFCEWAERYEDIQADEVLIAAMIFCVAFFGLFIRRNSELQRHLRARAAAVRMATEDELTGLPNRRAFMERAGEVLRRGRGCTVMVLDIDGFKAVNDKWGHEAGDEVLHYLALRLRELVEQAGNCFAARLGGDEFAIVVEHTDVEVTGSLADKVIETMADPLVRSHHPGLGASVGIATHVRGAVLSATLRKADRAMYLAKQSGGSCYRHAPFND